LTISLIIPTLNVEKKIQIIFNNSKLYKFKEVIIVDGGSKDNTISNLKKFGFKVFQSIPSRGEQLNLGAAECNATWLLFIHADTFLNKKNIKDIKSFIKKKENQKKVAYFHLKFNSKKISSKLISSWANIRTRIFRLPYGDQGLLIKREYYFELGGYEKIKLMEDINFIRRIPYENRHFLNTSVRTSFAKYIKNGVFKQCMIHFLCQLLFYLKFNHTVILRFYKKYGN
tara:strand:- start:201 stop:884 length:684 start_codon:yes stop_codon:yes gene_type:complete